MLSSRDNLWEYKNATNNPCLLFFFAVDSGIVDQSLHFSLHVDTCFHLHQGYRRSNGRGN